MILEKTKPQWDFFFSYSGLVSVPLFMLLLRVMDELKDYETDKRLFKNRPLVTGVVLLQDVKLLMYGIMVLLIGLNIFHE